MSNVARFLRRDPAEVEPWAETCGQIRPLIEERDGAAAEVHHVEIQDAKLHYHEKTDEVYYVIEGSGSMVLNDEEIEAGLRVIAVPVRSSAGAVVAALCVSTHSGRYEIDQLKRRFLTDLLDASERLSRLI